MFKCHFGEQAARIITIEGRSIYCMYRTGSAADIMLTKRWNEGKWKRRETRGGKTMVKGRGRKEETGGRKKQEGRRTEKRRGDSGKRNGRGQDGKEERKKEEDDRAKEGVEKGRQTEAVGEGSRRRSIRCSFLLWKSLQNGVHLLRNGRQRKLKLVLQGRQRREGKERKRMF